MDGVDDLERYLTTASVLYGYEPQLQGGGGHPDKFAVVLEGGVTALCKPSGGVADGGRATKNEAAAWAVARILRWTDLVAATVIRRLRSPTTGTMEEMALQILWPGIDMHPDIARFTDHERWRAAVFDAVILHNDRGSNWVGVPSAAQPFKGAFSEHRQQLKLIDHGYAFNYPGRDALNSAFVNWANGTGEAVPEHLLQDLRRLAAQAEASSLAALLDPPDCAALVTRVEKVISDRAFQ